MRRSRALPSAAVVLALSVLGACGSADPAAPGSAPTQASTAGATSAKRLSVTVTGSTVSPPPAQVELAVGQTLELTVTSDHDDELHAHGFDAEAPLKAGVPATISLTGRSAGVYEVETHEPALTLLTVAVR